MMMDEDLLKLTGFSTKVDNFNVGASSANNETSVESQIKRLEACIQTTNADILSLRTLIDIVKTGRLSRSKKDETPFQKYETEIAEFASCIKHPQNLFSITDEARVLHEAFKMKPEEVEKQSPPVRNCIQIVQTATPQLSDKKLELLSIQSEITKRLRDVQSTEVKLMKMMFKHADDLLEQKQQMEMNKSSKDKQYDRKMEKLKTCADHVNKLKNFVQGLIGARANVTDMNERLLDLIIKTRKPVDILTYEMSGLLQ